VTPSPESVVFSDDGAIPNSPLPVLVYTGVEEGRSAASCERLFAANGWLGAWRNGVYPFHHFHSTAHEVLGVVAGSARLMLGGPSGREFFVEPGNVLVLPAGTGHCRLSADADFLVVGAYPDGMSWDVCRGDPAEHDAAVERIRRVPLPSQDPVGGADGALCTAWPSAWRGA
jgi:uncharacterized protein YjlB